MQGPCLRRISAATNASAACTCHQGSGRASPQVSPQAARKSVQMWRIELFAKSGLCRFQALATAGRVSYCPPCAEHGARVGRSQSRGPYAEAESLRGGSTKAKPARRISLDPGLPQVPASFAPPAVTIRLCRTCRSRRASITGSFPSSGASGSGCSSGWECSRSASPAALRSCSRSSRRSGSSSSSACAARTSRDVSRRATAPAEPRAPAGASA